MYVYPDAVARAVALAAAVVGLTMVSGLEGFCAETQMQRKARRRNEEME
jgi:hypothetical protein